MEKISKLNYEARFLFNELHAAEQSIKQYLKTSEKYKYYNNIIKKTKAAIKNLYTQMTHEEQYSVGKWLVNTRLMIARSIIKDSHTTNSQRIKQLHKHFELSEVARIDSYSAYFLKTILDY